MFRSIGARLATGLVLSTMLLGAAVSPVAAASHTRWVDNNTKGGGPAACNSAHFHTIQAAINASSPGDKVYVCPGNYQEQLSIDVPNLEVRSIPALGATLWAPDVLEDYFSGTAEVLITAPNDQLVGFRIKFNDGDLPNPPVRSIDTACVPVDAAVWAVAPHATIKANHIKTVGDNTLSGACGYEFGIVLWDPLGDEFGGEFGPDTSLVWRNWVRDFKDTGILVEGDRSARVFNNNVAYVHYNDPATCNLVPVLGVNPSLDYPCGIPLQAQNVSPMDGLFPNAGIAVEGGLADLRENIVHSTIDTSIPEEVPQLSFLFSGIIMDESTDGSKLRSNEVDNTFAGIVVTDTGDVPIPVQWKPTAPDGVAVSGNRVSETVFSFDVAASDGYYYANRAHLNIFGMFVADGENNTFDHNDFRYNAEIDCLDETTGSGSYGTANTWMDPNLGFSDEPDGICLPFGF